MSEEITLEVDVRQTTGKAVKRLRQDGLLPAVIHNHGKESIVVEAPYLTLYKVYQQAGKHHPVHVKAGGHSYTTLIKSATFEPHHNRLTHLVFNAVSRNQKVEAEVPIRPRYAEGEETSPAERTGLIVLSQLDAVEVRAVPDRIPDALTYDAERLVNEGDQVTVADLEGAEGIEVLAETEHPVATVTTTAALEAKNAEAGGTAEAETEVPSEQGAEAEAGTSGEQPAAEAQGPNKE